MNSKNKTMDNNNNSPDGSLQRSKKKYGYNNIAEININQLFPDDYNGHKNQLSEILREYPQDERSTQEGNKQVTACSSSVSEPEILSLIAIMSDNVAYLVEKVKSLTKQISEMGKNSVLQFNVDRSSMKEEDLPLLQKSDIFQLPITEQARLEELENELNADGSFKIFFVSQKCYSNTVSPKKNSCAFIDCRQTNLFLSSKTCTSLGDKYCGDSFILLFPKNCWFSIHGRDEVIAILSGVFRL